MNNSYYVCAMYTHQSQDTYVITTGNRKDKNGDDRNDTYRTTKKTFLIEWAEY